MSLRRCGPPTLNPQSCTLNPQPSILHPAPCTPNPQPCTLNPEPCNPRQVYAGGRNLELQTRVSATLANFPQETLTPQPVPPFRVQGSGCRVQGAGFRVQGPRVGVS